mmetsp:Transcript_35372/g.112524  ORF Transcript_35372/g.112524 Transcript_35372/m.112524 type:complete len:335 (+) Transcript_35372:35-1039(+)
MTNAFETYQPRDDAKSCFYIQLLKTEEVHQRLCDHFQDLKTKLGTGNLEMNRDKFTPDGDKPSTVEDQQNSDSNGNLQEKFAYLEANLSVYSGVRKMIKMRDIVVENKYQQAANGSMEKRQAAEIYEKMAQVLHLFEKHFLSVLGAPDCWFKVQAAKMVAWHEENPCAAVGIIVGCAALGTAVRHIYHLCAGMCVCECTAGTLAFTALGGLCVGVGVVALLGLSLKAYRSYHPSSEQSSEELRAINEAVARLEAMPEQEIRQELDGLFEKLGACPFLADVPGPEDRKCVICLKDQENVRNPVKAPSCQGRHYMCASCCIDYFYKYGFKCPVCRV